jgi:hypothetical protein
MGVLALEYAEFAYLTRPGSLPGAVAAAWFQWWWLPMFALVFVFTPLLFPTGRMLSARWRLVAVVAAIGTAAVSALGALQPTLTLQDEDYTVPNPIGRAGVPDPEEGVLGAVLFGLLVFCGVAAVFSLVLRFRRSQGVERQQLKWFTYAAALAILLNLVPNPLPEGAVTDVLFGLTIALIPIAAGIAILRHRPYDIDRLINPPWSTRRSPPCSAPSTPARCWSAGGCSAGWVGSRRAGWWPGRPWRWRRCSGRPAAAPRRWWTGASTGASTTPPGRWRPSACGSATRSTWTRVGRAARGGEPDDAADPGVAVAATARAGS